MTNILKLQMLIDQYNKYVYLCKTNVLQMKNIFLLTILTSLCLLFSSCSDGDSDVSKIDGTWYAFERTVVLTSEKDPSYAKYLQDRINEYYGDETNKNDITKKFDPEKGRVTTTMVNKESGKEISKTEYTYKMEGESLTINDMVYGSTVSQCEISGNVMTMHREIKSIEIIDIADQLGIALDIPDDIGGTLKTKDHR